MSITLSSSETSNRDWNYQFEVDDEDTGEPIDLTGAFIAIAITDKEGCQRIYATTDNGMVAIVTTGIITLAIPEAQTNLCAGTYDIGGYYQLNGATLDLLDGSIAVRTGRPRP
jgi:hypothetical protein